MKKAPRYILLGLSAFLLMSYLLNLIIYISNANSTTESQFYRGTVMSFVYDSPPYNIHLLPIAISVLIIALLGAVTYLLAVHKYRPAKTLGIFTYGALLVLSLIQMQIFLGLLFLLAIGMFIGNKGSKAGD